MQLEISIPALYGIGFVGINNKYVSQFFIWRGFKQHKTWQSVFGQCNYCQQDVLIPFIKADGGNSESVFSHLVNPGVNSIPEPSE